MSINEKLIETAIVQGAFKAAVIPVCDISLDASFRTLCESNTCGKFGRCWTCPPDCGEIDELMESLKDYDLVLVYQTVEQIEDSFDIEGMGEAAKKHSRLTAKMREAVKDIPFSKVLHLGAGGCHICETCTRTQNQPCRYPELAMASLEAYGINVSKLAPACNMKYINGQNTVTFFGAVFFSV